MRGSGEHEHHSATTITICNARAVFTSRRLVFAAVTPFASMLFALTIFAQASAQPLRVDGEGRLLVPPAFLTCKHDADCTVVKTPCNWGWEIINTEHAKNLAAFLAGIPLDCEGLVTVQPVVGCRDTTCVLKPKDGCLLRAVKGECVKTCAHSDANGYCSEP